jgi:hypothetical protein
MSGKSPKRGPGIPLGTTAGVFDWFENRVVAYLVLSDPIEMEYVDERSAELACLHLKYCLVDGDDESAATLRTHFTSGNLLEFLADHMKRDGLLAMRWTTSVTLDADGLRARFPTGEWRPIHCENMTEFKFLEPSRRLSTDLSPRETYLYERFRLSRAFVHEGRGRVACPPSEFFGEIGEE